MDNDYIMCCFLVLNVKFVLILWCKKQEYSKKESSWVQGKMSQMQEKILLTFKQISVVHSLLSIVFGEFIWIITVTLMYCDIRICRLRKKMLIDHPCEWRLAKWCVFWSGEDVVGNWILQGEIVSCVLFWTSPLHCFLHHRSLIAQF